MSSGSSFTTLADGSYSFTGLGPGAYTISVDVDDLPPTAASTTGGDSRALTLSGGENNLDVDFGYVELIAVGDRVWHDLDADERSQA